jgi:hypothetical protein
VEISIHTLFVVKTDELWTSARRADITLSESANAAALTGSRKVESDSSSVMELGLRVVVYFLRVIDDWFYTILAFIS